MELFQKVSEEMSRMSILASASTKNTIRHIAVGALQEKYPEPETIDNIPAQIIQSVIKETAEKVINHCGISE